MRGAVVGSSSGRQQQWAGCFHTGSVAADSNQHWGRTELLCCSLPAAQHAPVLVSQPQAPRCVMRRSISSASTTVWRLGSLDSSGGC